MAKNLTPTNKSMSDVIIASQEEVVSTSEIETLSLISSDVSKNNPQYTRNYEDIMMVRDALEGENHIREVACDRDYLRIPSGINPEFSENDLQKRIDMKNLKGFLSSANYPEVVNRSIEFAISMALSSPFEIVNRPKQFTDSYLNRLDNEGRSFHEFIQKILFESLATRGGAVVQDLKSDGSVKLVFYNWESVPNRRFNSDGELQFAVFEEYTQKSDEFLKHSTVRERIIIFKNPTDENDKNIYTQRFQSSDEQDDLEINYKNRIDKFFNNKQKRPYEIDSYTPVSDIITTDFKFMPIEFLCSSEYKKSIYLPLTKACLEYFRSSANLENALYHAANPTPYIKFSENGNFYDAENPGQEEDTPSLVIRKGTERPLIFKEGDYKFAQVGDSGISFLMKKLEMVVEKIASLGAKSFSSKQATNVSAETQKIQTFSENSIVGLVLNEVETSITSILRNVARLEGLPDADKILFRFSKSTGIDDFSSEDFSFLAKLQEEDIIPKSVIRAHARRTKFIPDNVTDEELDDMIDEEQSKQLNIQF